MPTPVLRVAKDDDDLVFVDDSQGGTRRLLEHLVVRPESLKLFQQRPVSRDTLVGLAASPFEIVAQLEVAPCAVTPVEDAVRQYEREAREQKQHRLASFRRVLLRALHESERIALVTGGPQRAPWIRGWS